MKTQAAAPIRFPLPALAVSACALLVFGFLANQALHGQTAAFDAGVRTGIHSLANPALTRTMKAVTFLGSSLCLVPAGCLVIWRLVRARRKHAAALLAISALGGEALDSILKLLFHRPRPEAFFGIVEPATYSFPSGHAVTACSFYIVLAAILSRCVRSKLAKAGLWTFAVVLAAAIGFSRVYLGVHYPSDVIAGYAVAVIWIVLLERGYAVWRRRTE